ncbi:MAG: DNA polymerase III subunit delta [Lachnospiraceae bacterium]|nr:DNA polymerase III subunit delta [Lachnospiraceae bacterium]
MKHIKEQISKGIFSPIYLLYGSEDYLVHQTKKMLCPAITDMEDTINFTKFEGKQTDPKEIASIAETMPFFQERRLILLEDTGFLKKASDDYLKILKELPETTIIVMVEQEVDKRNKIYKYIKTNGYICECTPPDEKTLMNWCGALLAKRGKKILKSDLSYLLAVTSTNMNQLKNELDKLADYAGERDVIKREDIDTIVTVEITNQIFDMISAIARKEQKKAMELYNHLLTLREPPMRILFLIARQFQLMLQIKDMKELRKTSKEMGQAAGLSPYIAEKYASQAQHFTKEKLKENLEKCAHAEEKVKTGQLGDRLAVELLIMQCSEKK